MDGMWHRHAKHATFRCMNEKGVWHIHPHPRLSEREVEQEEGWIDPVDLQGIAAGRSDRVEDPIYY